MASSYHLQIMEILMMRIDFCAAIALCAFTSSAALAQQAIPRNGVVAEGYIAVQSGISMSLPFDQNLPADEQIQKAQKSLYAVASKSCSAVLDTIADDCKITGMTSNVDMQRGNRRNHLGPRPNQYVDQTQAIGASFKVGIGRSVHAVACKLFLSIECEACSCHALHRGLYVEDVSTCRVRRIL
jgi:hypothetical protein